MGAGHRCIPCVDALVHGATDLMRGLWAESDQQSQFSLSRRQSRSDPMRAVQELNQFRESLMTDFQWLVAVVTALSTARVSRLVTWDSFPPSVGSA